MRQKPMFLIFMMLLLSIMPVVDAAPQPATTQQVYSGIINNFVPYVEYPFTVEQDGSTIILDLVPDSNNPGNLDPYLYLVDGNGNIIDENDDRARGDFSSYLEFPQAAAGNYTAIATRYGVADGASFGGYEMRIEVIPEQQIIPQFNVSPEAITATGFPALAPQPTAQWTVFAYYGGDNNLEPGLQFDFNEFEIGGGSNANVRVIMLLDRHPEYSDANGNWVGARVYEITADLSADETLVYPPTIDSQPLAELGTQDTGRGELLAQFLVWGIQHYPAEHYAVSIASHGAAWKGIVTDDTAVMQNPDLAYSIITVPQLTQAFQIATQAAGVERFDLLINDACSMSSIEYFTGVSPYFTYSLASPEIVVDPALDMAVLLRQMNAAGATLDVPTASSSLVDKYILQDMLLSGNPDTTYFTYAVSDLTQFDPVRQAVEEFAAIVNENPELYAQTIGAARTNTYTYTQFAGGSSLIDLGSFMRQVIINTQEGALIDAATAVLDALDSAIIYKNGGDSVRDRISYYSIYFPEVSARFQRQYLLDSPLSEWGRMLRNYYNIVTPQVWMGSELGVPFHPPVAPKVNITNVYPFDTASVTSPVTFSFEIVGHDIAFVEATYDQIQPDGSAIRLSSERVLVPGFDENGSPDRVNQWYDGVNVSEFFWDVALPVISDGTTAHNELLVINDDVAFLDGVYQEPGGSAWNDVSVVFSNALDAPDGVGRVLRVVNRSSGSDALAVVSIPEGSTFVAYRGIVTPDGRIVTEPGNSYIWSAEGLTYTFEPAPAGDYNIGLLASAYGGTTGYAAETVSVDNTGVNADLRANTYLFRGFTVTRPKNWTFLVPNDVLRAYQSVSLDGTANISVYLARAENLAENLENVVDWVFTSGAYPYFANVIWDRQYTSTTINGNPAIEFTFTYTLDGNTYDVQAAAMYNPTTKFGLIFTAQSINGQADIAPIYQQMIENLQLVDAAAFDETSVYTWHFSYYTGFGRAPFVEEVEYPIPANFEQSQEGIWTRYSPVDDLNTFVAMTTLPPGENTASQLASNYVVQYGAVGSDGYEVLGTRTYNGYHPWSAVIFNVTKGEQVYISRMYVTLMNGKAYVIWTQTPDSESAAETYKSLLEPMIDGFYIYPLE
ncbi:MAG: hypothetical protein CUN56_11080 [Phototrophicales bacterium]|nr:MAG: hypothetical protein CUN56_11080 [Phototrophicales bacterium]